MKVIQETFKFGQHTVTLETGRMARQANSVIVTIGETMVLVTAVASPSANEGADFFPLTVHYQEKTYAAGKIPGGFLKREGRPSEMETLTSRLIDRPIRPLFPEGFCNEIQIVATVLSLDTNISADIPAIIGASAALSISGVPFQGPIAAARVGYANQTYLLNPSETELATSDLNLVVAGTERAVLMVESEAKGLSEEVMLGAVMFGHEQMQTAIQAIKKFAKAVNNPIWDWKVAADEKNIASKVEAIAKDSLDEAYQIAEKLARQNRVAEIRDKVIEQVSASFEEDVTGEINRFLDELEKRLVRQRVLSGKSRIDGRDLKTVRPITIETGVLPRAHGSALFTRGETQALAVVTLGTKKDGQLIDALQGSYHDRFMFHYNFPPFCVGEVGMLGSPKRREIGHARLAKRGVQAVIPNEEQFPYVLRIVSEIMESNGSSSMASVCGSSLALMDAGVPISNHVAGIAMGLIKEGDQFAVLTDILGDEDHLGDMDFKVAGTRNGITALQMDIKIDGINKEIMEKALHQAKEGRLHILGLMETALAAPREEMSEYAPRFYTMKIPTDKIRDVIGKGGAVIRELTEQTGTTIEIEDDGSIKIAAVNKEAAEDAMARIRTITAEVEVGAIYEGKVVKIVEFGAFVSVIPGREGLVHISQIADKRVERVSDELTEGQVVRVRVLEIDRQGRVRLSMKPSELESEPSESQGN